MSVKWLPNGDLEFKSRAMSVVRNLADAPARFEISDELSKELTEKVERYSDALQQSHGVSRSRASTMRKEEARAEAEVVLRRIGNLVRANPRVEPSAKIQLGLRERSRPKTAKPLTCPQEPPRLKFKRALHEGGAVPVHELEFRALDYTAGMKPEGAARLELFVDLVEPGSPIPTHPGENLNSRPWYLRSYARSPIRLTPPMAREAMRVVYWARWADAQGNTGPFSATAVAWIEGGCPALLPGGVGMERIPDFGKHKPIKLIDTDIQPGGGGAERDVRFRIAVIEAQVRSLIPNQIERSSLPVDEGDEQRQIEGPPKSEAA
jgi:hypothetical protein